MDSVGYNMDNKEAFWRVVLMVMLRVLLGKDFYDSMLFGI